MMKKKTVWITLIVVVVVLIISIVSSYNGFVNKEETVKEEWSKVSVQLQRRADLIPNIVSTVKGYTDYEQETLTAVTQARNAFNGAGSVNEQIEASNQLESALDIWVNAVTEAYPELKADTQFTALQDELSGTENRISTARTRYNEAAKKYNTSIKRFPGRLLAGIFGFDSYEYFEAQAGAENVPEVNFD